MSQESKFDIWWNSPKVKRFVGILYSLGASIVIVGAMGKILHTSWGAAMLGVGMSVEAVLFALGIFDKPHKEFDWHKVFDFESDDKIMATPSAAPGPKKAAVHAEALNDDDYKKLSDSVKHLSTTAQQLGSLTNVVAATEDFGKNMASASKATGLFVQSQETLNSASNKLATAYSGVSADMDEVVKNTKHYSGKVEEVTKSLAAINSIYEIQLKNIQAQSQSLTQQTEQIKVAGKELELVATEAQKMKAAALAAAAETEKYKEGTAKLTKQIADLNQVYGNMLNALS